MDGTNPIHAIDKANAFPGATQAEPRLVWKSLDEIQPSPENDLVYKRVSEQDPAIVELARSISKMGLLEPLTITTDGYIVSGHRRYAACRLAGLAGVDCQVLATSREGDRDEYMRLLCEFNLQRDKTFEERVREALVRTKPDQAYQELVHRRVESRKVHASTVKLRGEKVRCQISDAKRPMLEAAKQVLNDRAEFLPLTVRSIHYALLNDPPLKHSGKPDSVYANDRKSYQDLSDLLTRARLNGEIPTEWIRDETRPVHTWDVHHGPSSYIQREMKQFLTRYWRDLMQTQPHHIEIVGEKNTVDPILSAVAADYTIPMTTGRGYASIPPRAQIASRFEQSGKCSMALIIVADFDPDGEEICQSFARSMRDDFGINDLITIKAALTHAQVLERNLPPSMDAKETSANFKRFKKQYGDHAYELEALEPDELQTLLRAAIDSVIDIDAYHREQDQERDDARQIASYRSAMGRVMAQYGRGGSP